MSSSPSHPRRRDGVPAVHSLHRFVFTVPDIGAAAAFYSDFGLDARRTGARVDLYTFGSDHRWGTIHQKPGPKRLQYVSFGAFEDDHERIVGRLKTLGIKTTGAHA